MQQTKKKMKENKSGFTWFYNLFHLVMQQHTQRPREKAGIIVFCLTNRIYVTNYGKFCQLISILLLLLLVGNRDLSIKQE